MQNRSRKLIITCALLFVIGNCLFIQAQNKRWRNVKGKSLIVFDWNCASPSVYPKSKLNRVVKFALKNDYSGVKTWADRALAFDLNADGKLEYFVPLVCGATGNCTWGVFSVNPAKFIGIVSGQYIYIHRGKRQYPDIITCAHMSASEGILATYSFRKNKYLWLGDQYPTNYRGGIYGNKIPAFLEKARSGCKMLGN